jgi:uncharacterized membrane protein
MAFCGKCGAALTEGNVFCASCGTRSDTQPQSSVEMKPIIAGEGGPGDTVNALRPPAVAGAAMSANVAGALAYLLGALTGILFLVLEPYRNDRLVRFHAFQSILLFAVWMIGGILWNVAGGALSVATGGFVALVSVPLGIVIFLVTVAYWVFVMYKAYANERYEIPFIGALAARQAG